MPKLLKSSETSEVDFSYLEMSSPWYHYSFQTTKMLDRLVLNLQTINTNSKCLTQLEVTYFCFFADISFNV